MGDRQHSASSFQQTGDYGLNFIESLPMNVPEERNKEGPY